ncbi:hypothetical protein D3C85_1911640 [compost metagenome]
MLIQVLLDRQAVGLANTEIVRAESRRHMHESRTRTAHEVRRQDGDFAPGIWADHRQARQIEIG